MKQGCLRACSACVSIVQALCHSLIYVTVFWQPYVGLLSVSIDLECQKRSSKLNQAC